MSKPPRSEQWSDLEAEFNNRWLQFAPTAPIPEHNVIGLIPGRKHEVDFLWRESKVIVEMEGATWLGGRGGHTSGKGFEDDCEKYDTLTAMGYRVFRLTRGMIRKDPIRWIALISVLVEPVRVYTNSKWVTWGQWEKEQK